MISNMSLRQQNHWILAMAIYLKASEDQRCFLIPVLYKYHTMSRLFWARILIKISSTQINSLCLELNFIQCLIMAVEMIKKYAMC